MNVISYLSKQLSVKVVPKENSDELTLQYWELWVSEGIRDAMRGNSSKITEIYVPELKLTINTANSPVNVFLCDYDRYIPNKNDVKSGKIPKLVKTVIISKNSEDAKTLIWLNEVYTKKKEREATLIKLFE